MRPDYLYLNPLPRWWCCCWTAYGAGLLCLSHFPGTSLCLSCLVAHWTGSHSGAGPCDPVPVALRSLHAVVSEGWLERTLLLRSCILPTLTIYLCLLPVAQTHPPCDLAVVVLRLMLRWRSAHRWFIRVCSGTSTRGNDGKEAGVRREKSEERRGEERSGP